MARSQQTYPFRKNASILFNQVDDYELSMAEYYLLYSFFVTYSCCGTQSKKKRSFAEYGWAQFARSHFSNSNPDKNVYLKDNPESAKFD